jgi:tetratricopeptide (TPR) repeat protein
MATTLSPGEEAQLAQTVEMFEVITQSQPQDYQSLEILKEAYSKLNREKDVVSTSKRIAQAYVQMGQISSAILEYETILQRYPEDAEVQKALKQIETQTNDFPTEAFVGDPVAAKSSALPLPGKAKVQVEDGRRTMYKLFVEGKIISASDFELCWPAPDLSVPPVGVVEPFVQVLAEKGVLPAEKAMKLLSDKSRFAYLPLNSYDIDMDLARSFPAEICQRWCILPFDRMSKSILVATVNPFNQQAAKDLAEATPNRLLWYLVPPGELVSNVRKAFR